MLNWRVRKGVVLAALGLVLIVTIAFSVSIEGNRIPAVSIDLWGAYLVGLEVGLLFALAVPFRHKR